MKVLQFVTRLDLGGAQEVCLDLCRALLARGDEVHLLTGAEGELLPDARTIRGLELLAWSDWRHEIRPIADLRCLLRLIRLLRDGGFRVLHTHSSKAGFFGRLAAAVAGRPARVVHHVHGWSFNRSQRPAVRRAFVALEKLAARPRFVLLACCDATDLQGREAGIGRDADRRVVVNGIDPRPLRARRDRPSIRRRLGLARRETLFLQLGNLKPQKDPLTFARAAGLAAPSLRRASFWIAGDGPLRRETESEADRAGLGRRFRVLGWRRDVDDLLRAADALVLTSRFEGLPMAVLRAMAAGLPVIASDVDGNSEAVDHGRTGLLVPPQDPRATAAAMVRLGSDPALRRRMAAAARIRARQFTAARAVAETLSIYDEPDA